MNIFNLLIKKRHVAGVEISDSFIHISYFRPRTKKNKENLPSNELVLIEEPIPLNVITNGIILDKVLFEKILKNIWIKEKLHKYYAVVSIPEDKIYSQIFSFPKTVLDETQIKDAVDLAIDFQLPFKRDDVYIGWKNINNPSHSTSKILISMIPKIIADDYIQILDKVGINLLALESHIASIIRSIKVSPEKITLIIKNNESSSTIFTIKDNNLQFSRTIPSIFLNKEKSLKDEVVNIKNSLESESENTINEIPFEESTIKDEYAKYPEITATVKKQSKWLISIGATIRGEIPQGQDNLISLLPVGTVEAYEYQKIKIFITLIRNIVIGISVFFLFAFCASYLFIFSISQNVNNASKIIFMNTVSPDMKDNELLIKKVNDLTLISESALSKTPNWSILIDEINSRTINGIIISNFRAPSINDTITLVGISKDRDTLNLFKKSLQDSTYLTGVELPITNLEKRLDIPFSITFQIKDPNMVYYK